jgi:amino acid permease
MWAPYPSPIRFISAVSITLVAYSYQFNLYPVYSSLQLKTNQQYMKTNNYGLALTLVIYTAVALISIAMFGDNL